MEGGHSIDNSLATLRMIHRLGARYMTLTHSLNTPWADAATDTPQHGLTAFGEEVVREMNWLGMLVDLSHVSPDTMADAIRVSQAPSSSRTRRPRHRRRPAQRAGRRAEDAAEERRRRHGDVRARVPLAEGHRAWPPADRRAARLREQHPNDEAARARPRCRRGTKANPTPRATIADTADHIDHIRKVAGIDHIGIGGDYDGITSVPRASRTSRPTPALTAELLRRGYSDDDVKKVLGLNVLRVMREAEKVSARTAEGARPFGDAFHEVSATPFHRGHGRLDDRGNTWLAVPDRGPAGSRIEGDETSQYAYWLMQSPSGVGCPQPRGEPRDQRADPRPLRPGRVGSAPRVVVIIAGVNDIYAGQPAVTSSRTSRGCTTAPASTASASWPARSSRTTPPRPTRTRGCGR
jgi:microsomal dipeptidase-like Zn-dependent dipeptidase